MNSFQPKSILTAAIALLLVAGMTQAAIVGPYTPDSDTLHLWHFDEANPGPAQPDAGLVSSFNLTPDDGKSPGSPATLGNPAFSLDFGTSGNASAGQGSGFMGNSIPVSDLTGANGSFTFEAVISLSNINDTQMIAAMENNGGAAARPFQFRVDGGNLRFINIAGGVQQILEAIPTTGDDAFVADEWFHVAATYDGNENTADNFKLYWTKLNDTQILANEILSTNMTSDLSGNNSIFGIGNDYRTSGTGNTNNLGGFIDEVRISSVARGANEFLFVAVPEPATATLALLGLGGMLIRRRRNAA